MLRSIILFFLFLVGFPVYAIDIDESMTGSWFDQSNSGQGINIEILSENRILVYWYTYDQGNPLWLTGVGSYQGDTAEIELSQFDGSEFGVNHNNSLVTSKIFGSLIISFDSCNSGTMTYSSILGLGNGIIPLNRLTNVLGLSCTSSAPPLVSTISENTIIKADGPCVTIGAISPETKIKLDLEFFEKNGSLNSTAKREQIIHKRDNQGALVDQSTVYRKIDGAFSHSTDENLNHKHEILDGFVYENGLDATTNFVLEDQSTLNIEISAEFSPAYFERPDTIFCEGTTWQISSVVETKVQDGVVSTANRPVKSGEVTAVNTSISVPAGTFNTVLIKARELEEERLEWIDIETGNTLKIENYDEGILENRHEVTSIN